MAAKKKKKKSKPKQKSAKLVLCEVIVEQMVRKNIIVTGKNAAACKRIALAAVSGGNVILDPAEDFSKESIVRVTELKTAKALHKVADSVEINDSPVGADEAFDAAADVLGVDQVPSPPSTRVIAQAIGLIARDEPDEVETVTDEEKAAA